MTMTTKRIVNKRIFPHPASKVTTSCDEEETKIECTTEPVEQCTVTSTVTETSTTSTTLTGDFCGPTSCGAACPVQVRAAVQPRVTPVLGRNSPEIVKFNEKRSLQKRAPPRPPLRQTNPSLTNDFSNPDAFPGGRQEWYRAAKSYVLENGAGNVESIQHGFPPSSRMLDFKNLDYPFKSGGGPSWGCTTLLVFSDRGMWQGHIWEVPTMYEDDTFNQVTLPFIKDGTPEFDYPGLRAAVPRYFGRDPVTQAPPLFIHVWAFTPQHVSRAFEDGTPMITPPRDGRPAIDAFYWHRMDPIADAIREVIPEEFQGLLKFQASLYPMINDMQAIVNSVPGAERGLAVFEYVPQHLRILDNGVCDTFRAARLIVPPNLRTHSVVIWKDASPGTPGPQKRDNGPCPRDIDAIIKGQGFTEGTEVIDPGNLLKAPAGGNSEGGGSQGGGSGSGESTEPEEPKDPTKDPDQPLPPGPTPTNALPLCSDLQLPARGSNIYVGSRCSGEGIDPSQTYTWALEQKRALETAVAA
ncbi:hypothetical protein jhhlp_002776 [Lomentospora prolificans]|uniref:Uncharacterized protein n=1 Tax=Lomentospora prolificans TaxID=41688 RepID=A0A2N3NF46_9PEZI|nr:hypothetical protein jhhlp_002776 [Lomentospora prolificans]